MFISLALTQGSVLSSLLPVARISHARPGIGIKCTRLLCNSAPSLLFWPVRYWLHFVRVACARTCTMDYEQHVSLWTGGLLWRMERLGSQT